MVPASRPENTTMPTFGLRARMSGMAARPSSPGIARSSSTTSGRNSATPATACTPSEASPTTLRPGSSSSPARVRSRISATSSQTNTWRALILILQDVVAARLALGAVHHLVGVVDQPLGRHVLSPAHEDDPDAETHGHRGSIDIERLAAERTHPFGERHRLAHFGHVLAEEDELVAAEAREGVGGPNGALQPARHFG